MVYFGPYQLVLESCDGSVDLAVLIVPCVKNDKVLLRVVRMGPERKLQVSVAGGGVNMTGLISYSNDHGVGSHDELDETRVVDLSLVVCDGEMEVVLTMVMGEPIRWLR